MLYMPKFYVCPLEPWAHKLAVYRHKGQAGTRIPIAERAARLKEQYPISMGQAMKYMSRRPFELNDNVFQLITSPYTIRPEHSALAVRHFGSVFSNSFIYLNISGDSDRLLSFTVKGFPLPSTRTGLSPEDFGHQLPSGEMEFNVNLLTRGSFLAFVGTHPSGMGGKLITALYNLAVNVNMKSIEFNVNGGWLNASRFYFHMDFGRPMFEPEITDRWVLELPQAC
jgi:hypothetical protein